MSYRQRGGVLQVGGVLQAEGWCLTGRGLVSNRQGGGSCRQGFGV